MAADDELIFAPRPRRVTFEIREPDAPPRRVETDLYSYLDLPTAQAVRVSGLDDELRAKAGESAFDFAGSLEVQRAIVQLLCPDLKAPDLVALVPRQLYAAIRASFAIPPDPPAGEGVGTASPSPSPGSTTSSPTPTAGAPTSSAR